MSIITTGNAVYNVWLIKQVHVQHTDNVFYNSILLFNEVFTSIQMQIHFLKKQNGSMSFHTYEKQ